MYELKNVVLNKIKEKFDNENYKITFTNLTTPDFGKEHITPTICIRSLNGESDETLREKVDEIYNILEENEQLSTIVVDNIYYNKTDSIYVFLKNTRYSFVYIKENYKMYLLPIQFKSNLLQEIEEINQMDPKDFEKIIKKYDEIDSTYKMYEIDIHTIQNYEFEHCIYNS